LRRQSFTLTKSEAEKRLALAVGILTQFAHDGATGQAQWLWESRNDGIHVSRA
jgi:hypothetical protein